MKESKQLNQHHGWDVSTEQQHFKVNPESTKIDKSVSFTLNLITKINPKGTEKSTFIRDNRT